MEVYLQCSAEGTFSHDINIKFVFPNDLDFPDHSNYPPLYNETQHITKFNFQSSNKVSNRSLGLPSLRGCTTYIVYITNVKYDELPGVPIVQNDHIHLPLLTPSQAQTLNNVSTNNQNGQNIDIVRCLIIPPVYLQCPCCMANSIRTVTLRSLKHWISSKHSDHLEYSQC